MLRGFDCDGSTWRVELLPWGMRCIHVPSSLSHFSQRNRAGVCRVSVVEDSHSRSLQPCRAQTPVIEINRMPFLGQPSCQFAATLSNQANNIKCCNLINYDIGKIIRHHEFLFSPVYRWPKECYLSLCILTNLGTRKGISLYLPSRTEHFSRIWCSG